MIRAVAAAPIPAASPEGQRRLGSAASRGYSIDLIQLSPWISPQPNRSFCNVQSIAAILNALGGQRPVHADATAEESAIAAEKRNRPGMSLNLRFWTAKSVLDHQHVTSREKIIHGNQGRFGLTLDEAAAVLVDLDKAVTTREVSLDDSAATRQSMRDEIIANLSSNGDYILANYDRSRIGQKGGGHFSPLAAYDPDTDSVLIADVNPTRAPWVWVTLDTLLDAMAPAGSGGFSRGYVLVENPPPAQGSGRKLDVVV